MLSFRFFFFRFFLRPLSCIVFHEGFGAEGSLSLLPLTFRTPLLLQPRFDSRDQQRQRQVAHLHQDTVKRRIIRERTPQQLLPSSLELIATPSNQLDQC
jgi:hypothetical protein